MCRVMERYFYDRVKGKNKLYNPTLAYKEYTCTQVCTKICVCFCIHRKISRILEAYSVNLTVVTSHLLPRDRGKEAIIYVTYCGV